MQNKEHQEVCKIRHLLNNVCIVKRPDKQMTARCFTHRAVRMDSGREGQ